MSNGMLTVTTRFRVGSYLMRTLSTGTLRLGLESSRAFALEGSATLVWLMAVENGRSVLRAANPGRPDIEVTRANETMIRGVVVFVGRAV